jgi:uncharacterized OB-fold protein
LANSQPIISLYDEPMWESIRARRWELQCCDSCGTFRYPPAPICANCLSMATTWMPLAGRGRIISWVVFHRQYFDDYPVPYNVVTVQLKEGPLVISNLDGRVPEGSWIGAEVEVCYGEHVSGTLIPKMRL